MRSEGNGVALSRQPRAIRALICGGSASSCKERCAAAARAALCRGVSCGAAASAASGAGGSSAADVQNRMQSGPAHASERAHAPQRRAHAHPHTTRHVRAHSRSSTGARTFAPAAPTVAAPLTPPRSSSTTVPCSLCTPPYSFVLCPRSAVLPFAAGHPQSFPAPAYSRVLATLFPTCEYSVAVSTPLSPFRSASAALARANVAPDNFVSSRCAAHTPRHRRAATWRACRCSAARARRVLARNASPCPPTLRGRARDGVHTLCSAHRRRRGCADGRAAAAVHRGHRQPAPSERASLDGAGTRRTTRTRCSSSSPYDPARTSAPGLEAASASTGRAVRASCATAAAGRRMRAPRRSGGAQPRLPPLGQRALAHRQRDRPRLRWGPGGNHP
jgi:hypothetical protein